MPAVFIDSWYFIASIDYSDSHHRNAERLARFVIGPSSFTHEGVLAEVLAYFSDGGAHVRATAVAMVRRAFVDFQVITVDHDLFLRALDLYERRPDKEYSLTDCVSMVVMRERGVTHVLTNDHHFRQEGFTVLSDAT